LIKVLFIISIGFSLLTHAQNELNHYCSSFTGGKSGVRIYYLQLCYDSTFFYRQWEKGGVEILEEGHWCFDQFSETIILNSKKLKYNDYANNNLNHKVNNLFDSTAFKLRSGVIYLFQEEWDTLPIHEKSNYQDRLLYYIVPEKIDEDKEAWQEKMDSIRRLGPFQKNPLYIHLFMTEDKGLLGVKNKYEDKREKRKLEMQKKKEAKVVEKKAAEEAAQKRKNEAYIAAQLKAQQKADKRNAKKEHDSLNLNQVEIVDTCIGNDTIKLNPVKVDSMENKIPKK